MFGNKEINFDDCGRHRSQKLERWGLKKPEEIKQCIDPDQPAAAQRDNIYPARYFLFEELFFSFTHNFYQ